MVTRFAFLKLVVSIFIRIHCVLSHFFYLQLSVLLFLLIYIFRSKRTIEEAVCLYKKKVEEDSATRGIVIFVVLPGCRYSPPFHLTFSSFSSPSP